MTTPAPGWYPTPEGDAMRYWDGTSWTAVAAPPVVRKRKSGPVVFLIALALIGVAVISMAIAGKRSFDKTDDTYCKAASSSGLSSQGC